jgi:hypothetical protein
MTNSIESFYSIVGEINFDNYRDFELWLFKKEEKHHLEEE